jgi:transaldolase
MPADTVKAVADPGEVREPLTADTAAAERVLAEAAQAGFDLDATTAELEREGVQSFCDSFGEIIEAMEAALVRMREGAHA